jgi:hypothetical protein
LAYTRKRGELAAMRQNIEWAVVAPVASAMQPRILSLDLKERRKRTGKLVRLFLFGKPDFPAKT